MRRISRKTLLVLVVAAIVFVAAACVPGLVPGTKGISAGRAPLYGQISIAPQPGGLGPVNGGAAFWNQAAGRPLFVVTTANPIIRFREGGPWCAPASPRPGANGCPVNTRRVVAFASSAHNADATLAHCTVFFDPSWVAANVPGRHLNARLWAHEIGHCLDLWGDVNDCKHTSVLSACFFWEHVLSAIPPTIHDTNQLRAAGYIR